MLPTGRYIRTNPHSAIRSGGVSGTIASMKIRLFNANNAAFLGVTIAFGAVACVMMSGHWGEWREPECDSLPVQNVASPSGNRRALHDQEACRSTDKLRTSVVVRTLNPSGTTSMALVFAATTKDALGAMSVGQRSLPLALSWKSDSELVISYPAGVVPDKIPPSSAGLKVSVVEQAPR